MYGMSVRTARFMVVASLCMGIGACFEAEKAEELVPDRTIRLTFTTMAGFDDFSSGGAALGIGVDETSDTALVVALRFRLPLYQDDFSPDSDVSDSLSAYLSAPAVAPIQALLSQYPALAGAITNTAGVRNMPHPLTAFLVEGVLGTSEPTTVHVADDGRITLVREDNPADLVTGSLRFRQVTDIAPDGTLVQGGTVTMLEHIDLEWSTLQQP